MKDEEEMGCFENCDFETGKVLGCRLTGRTEGRLVCNNIVRSTLMFNDGLQWNGVCLALFC